ncbi:hypothetical protein BKM31_08965 [[Actinomadura] parvosata subsp. kistnae]|uniref:Uncharacterized protein n=1 Tax=[Actinomadura] parvosata subsp. kistnae TaxID=1909395 RepID=A0A1U9ZUG3_9ACTN|nr:hypothetical protein BKM31_08965 [Nonomuraea sp. ATCC 55076]
MEQGNGRRRLLGTFATAVGTRAGYARPDPSSASAVWARFGVSGSDGRGASLTIRFAALLFFRCSVSSCHWILRRRDASVMAETVAA